MKELHLYKLKVDFISDSATNAERALKMESVMSSFRLFMATSICAGQPQSVQGNLNLCRATSICAGQPQSVQNNLNLCKTTSIHAKQPQFVQRKKFGFKKSFEPPEISRYFLGFFSVHELRLFCMN